MTFSIAARCPRTQRLGIAITTSNLAVGSRCSRIAPGFGAFLSQHRTDPRLGDLGIKLIAQGLSAAETVAEVVKSDAGAPWRQLAALDRNGDSAVHHGAKIYSIHAQASAPNCIAIGNILANDRVPRAMLDAFLKHENDTLGERLVQALEAGAQAGGEVEGPLRSAAVLVSGEDGLERCNLRIDMSDDAVADLRQLWDAYHPGEETMVNLALQPASIPVARSLFESSLRRIRELDLVDEFPTERHREDWWVEK